MCIDHLLLTRFNLQYEPNDSNAIQPEWLEERLRLFELYCLPSVQRQTCQQFKWILFGDVRTPDAYKRKMERYLSLVPQMHLYWVPYQEDSYHSLYMRIAQETADADALLVTSRMDNDDSIAPNYIESVQQLVQNGMDGILSFPKGKQTFVRDHKSYIIRFPKNHFTSMVERGTFNTILAYDHTQIDSSDLHLIETSLPMWEEIVHGGNITNDYVPEYKYYTSGPTDIWDLSKRWIRFQTNRLVRLGKRLFVPTHKG